MKKFAFSLETLQKTKLSQKRELEKEFSAIEDRLNTTLLALDHIRQESSILREVWLARMINGLNPLEIQQFNSTFSQLNEQAKAQQTLVQKINQEKAQCQERLIRLLTDIKSLDNLKEQQYALYKQEMEKESANEIDDFVTGHRKQIIPGIG